MTDTVVAITDSALAAHTTTSGFHKLGGPKVQKVIHFIYITILMVDVITDTVEVVQFPRDAGTDKELTKHMRNLWILGVAVSWCLFFIDIYIIVRVVKSSSIGPQVGTRYDSNTTYKYIIAHQILVIIFEDFLISFVGIILVVSGAVLPSDLQSLSNKVSIIATAISMQFQIILYLYLACQFVSKQDALCCCLKCDDAGKTCWRYFVCTVLLGLGMGAVIGKGTISFSDSMVAVQHLANTTTISSSNPLTISQTVWPFSSTSLPGTFNKRPKRPDTKKLAWTLGTTSICGWLVMFWLICIPCTQLCCKMKRCVQACCCPSAENE